MIKKISYTKESWFELRDGYDESFYNSVKAVTVEQQVKQQEIVNKRVIYHLADGTDFVEEA